MPAATPAPVSLKEFDVASLFVADKATRDASAATLAALAQEKGPAALSGVSDAILKALADKNSPAAREGAADTVRTLAKSGGVKALEPSFIGSGIYAALLEAFADKMPAVRTAAVEAVREFAANMNPWATALILPALLHDQNCRQMADQDWLARCPQPARSQLPHPDGPSHARDRSHSRRRYLGHQSRCEEGCP
jgi:elongation factor 3